MRLLTVLLAAIFLYSCGNEDMKSSGSDNNVTDSLQKSLLSVIKGTWVESDYMKDIQRTKSPIQSANKLVSIVMLVIPEKETGDSIEIKVSNNHEGWGYFVHFNQGRAPNSFATSLADSNDPDGTELGYEVIGKDTSLFLYRYEKNKLVDKIRFFKVHDEDAIDEWTSGFQYAVNQRLFTGNYTLTDSTGSTTKVRFNSNGSVNGLQGFKNYYIFTDLEGIEKEDVIFFDMDTKNRTDYAFEIRGDTINLYNVTRGAEGEPETRGDLKYQLVRE